MKVAQLYPTLSNLMDCSTPGFPVLHYLSEVAQTHVYWVSDAIQLSYYLLPLLLLLSIFPSIRVFSSESGLQVAKVLELQLHISSSNEYLGKFPLGLIGLISLLSKGLSRVFSNTAVQKHQFFIFFYCPALTSIQNYWKNHSFDYMDICWQSNVSSF